MWCLGELGIPFERLDWGGPFGGNEAKKRMKKGAGM
jgi:hypothetical protein